MIKNKYIPIIPQKPDLNELTHFGVPGMKWGVRKAYEPVGRKSSVTKKTKEEIDESLNSFKERAIALAYKIGAWLNPRELTYNIRKAFTNPDDEELEMARLAESDAKQNGILTTNKKMLTAIESKGILEHRKAKYDNINDTDISRFEKYTDAARYSRGINEYLGTGQPKMYALAAKELKDSLSKNSVDNITLYRSCNFKFSTPGLAKKLESMSEAQLQKTFDSLAKNYKGKSLTENRVFSTSTSPLFAIDTWRSVNPTAAANYNTYMIINAKKCPGILADGRTRSGKTLVNTRSNQEGILAPKKLTYRNLRYDKKRKMFVLEVDAE